MTPCKRNSCCTGILLFTRYSTYRVRTGIPARSSLPPWYLFSAVKSESTEVLGCTETTWGSVSPGLARQPFNSGHKWEQEREQDESQSQGEENGINPITQEKYAFSSQSTDTSGRLAVAPSLKVYLSSHPPSALLWAVPSHPPSNFQVQIFHSVLDLYPPLLCIGRLFQCLGVFSNQDHGS